MHPTGDRGDEHGYEAGEPSPGARITDAQNGVGDDEHPGGDEEGGNHAQKSLEAFGAFGDQPNGDDEKDDGRQRIHGRLLHGGLLGIADVILIPGRATNDTNRTRRAGQSGNYHDGGILSRRIYPSSTVY